MRNTMKQLVAIIISIIMILVGIVGVWQASSIDIMCICLIGILLGIVGVLMFTEDD